MRTAIALVGGLMVVLVVIEGTWLGFAMQPWGAGIWGPAGPGVVPLPAVVPPIGPLLGEDAALTDAIRPWMGVRYLFGGTTRAGVDCSAFVQAVTRTLGHSLPRTAQQQWNATARVSQPETGDLVFFQNTYASPDRITHVGFVVGAGVMVSAAEPAVGRQSLTGFWQTHLAGYGRIR